MNIHYAKDFTQRDAQDYNTYVKLNLKLNCHVEVPGGYSPCSFMNVNPN